MSGRTETERRGRGRLSRLDMLPEEAQADLLWLNQELREAKRPQNELRDIFNMRLAALGIEPISNGSFSRYSVRKAMQFRDLDETMRLSRELVDAFGVDSSDRMTIALAEMIKMTAVKLVEAEGSKLAAKDLMELARAAQAVTSAQKQSADYRRQLKLELQAELAEAKKDIAGIGKALGVSDEAMQKITNRLAGIG
ncbi:terminase small subunit [Microcystis phage Mwe-Yong1]|nr:terminase small subunit [Microcystis phage Mwe-Yong1]